MDVHRNSEHRNLRRNVYVKELYGDLKLSEIIKYLSNGLKLGMYYCGAGNINELQKCKFVRTKSRR